MTSPRFDIAIIGGGIVGLATAMALSSRPGLSLVVLEAEEQLAAHQTGHNSGVIHSGLYYRPSSLRARTCVEGREKLQRFCEEQGIAHERCGKLVVATREDELPALAELERRGAANGLRGLHRLGAAQMRETEPHVAGIAGLHVPEAGIVDFSEVARRFAEIARSRGAEIQTGARVVTCRVDPAEIILGTARGEVRCRHLINCAGLQSDRIARLCGVAPGVRIVPFRGDHFRLVPERRSLVRHLIYPVPDPRFPFLGAHFTRTIRGEVEAGPNAVLALKREGYGKASFSLRDAVETFAWGGFWRLATRHWRVGLGELHRSLSKRAFVRALQQLVPEVRAQDLQPGGAGVRAQALGRDGQLVDDFAIVEAPRMLHVLNAPSPAATASIAIGEAIAAMAERNFDLQRVARGGPNSW